MTRPITDQLADYFGDLERDAVERGARPAVPHDLRRRVGSNGHVPGGETQIVCSSDQVVRTGCQGDYRVFTYWASLSFTLQY